MKIDGKKILVTGGAGFIGSHLTTRLVKMGAEVTVIDDLSTGKIENLKEIWNLINFVNGDVRNKRLIAKIVPSMDIIFHFAANASVPLSVSNPRLDFESNAVGTFNLLEASINSSLEKFIYASTAAVYGKPVYTPIDEKHPLSPISPYGSSKLAGERAGFAFKESYCLPFVAVRIFNVYGPKQPRYVVHDFIQNLRKDPAKLEVLGDGNQVRDLCYITDAIEAFIQICQKGDGVYNVATGSSLSIRDLAELIVSKISPAAAIRFGGKVWVGDVKTFVADIQEIKKIGFMPKIDISDGVQKTIDWFIHS